MLKNQKNPKTLVFAGFLCLLTSLSVGIPGFEPGTPCSQRRCANRTALHPENILLRREGDSNPRYGCPYGSLANCWFQPLTHLSVSLFIFMKNFLHKKRNKVRQFSIRQLPDQYLNLNILQLKQSLLIPLELPHSQA